VTLWIAIGNTLRRDDGAAHRVLDLLGAVEGIRCHQLTPEMAEEISTAEKVVFIDADINPGEARIEPLDDGSAMGRSPTHFVNPAELVALARQLFGFAGKAWLCHVPGEDFSDGEGLSPVAEAHAKAAATLLEQCR
jgi:hydrogenase maturation protease